MWPYPRNKNPCPWGHESNNFVRPFLVYQYYILSLSDLYLGVEEKILKEIMHFHYMTFMATHQLKNPCPGGHEILVDPSLVIIMQVYQSRI